MKKFKQFLEFCQMQLETGDYDAHIPSLEWLVQDLELDRENAIWLGLLYMAYYTEGSMWVAWLTPGVQHRRAMPPLGLPITTQRRNLYGGRLEPHLADLMEIDSFTEWFAGPVVSSEGPREPIWRDLLDRVGSVYGNGRWASYTTSELLTHMAEIDVEPTSYEIINSSGPRKGIQALGLEPTEQACQQVMAALEREGVEVLVSQLESLLCDWAGMNKGTFYAGRNIDRQQGRIVAVEEKCNVRCATLWRMRRAVFPRETLGEHKYNGWVGIDRKRLKAYSETGKVLRPEEER